MSRSASATIPGRQCYAASMGRRRQPTALLEASGAMKLNPGRYAERLANEPEPQLGVSQPSWLSERAKKHWDEFKEVADDMRVLTSADAFALAVLAEAFAEWFEANKRIADKRGQPPLPRELSALDKGYKRFSDMLKEFGMTPASRSKVKVHSKKPKENEFGALANRGRVEEDEDDQ